ncbi:uncharacterized protein LOC115397800 [Salarias fasciatus]|uniref:uncharacterized protein LOC115397800 n=1 Tax=Salarias fasciatus TaxID=181472 RepID=UPI0011766B05|nr:uncharacterized protein LOC115397800 [Salarias fasciatus]
MNYRTGFVCVWIFTLMANGDARRSQRKHAARVSCRPRELIALTKTQMEASLAAFDNTNGKHLGTWSPGFPELKVHRDSPVNESKVLCSLSFMAQGLEEVLEDQKNDLNPTAESLHKKLRDTISTVNMLAACLRSVLHGECSPEPSPPTLPEQAFQRKQWGHTLLKTAREYLNWLQHNFVHRVTQIRVRNGRHRGSKPRQYLEGSGYHL